MPFAGFMKSMATFNLERVPSRPSSCWDCEAIAETRGAAAKTERSPDAQAVTKRQPEGAGFKSPGEWQHSERRHPLLTSSFPPNLIPIQHVTTGTHRHHPLLRPWASAGASQLTLCDRPALAGTQNRPAWSQTSRLGMPKPIICLRRIR